MPINLKDILFAVMYIGILGPYRHFQLFIEVLPRDKIIPIIFLGISYHIIGRTYRKCNGFSQYMNQNKPNQNGDPSSCHFTKTVVEDTSNLFHHQFFIKQYRPLK